MSRTRFVPFAAAALALVLLLTVAATAEERSVTVDFGDGEKGGLSIQLKGEWLSEVLEDLAEDSIDCDSEPDPETREMLLHLRKRGEGSSYTLRDGDEVTKAKRRNGKLEFKKLEPGEEPTTVVLPWAMGECMLGNPKPLRKLGKDFEMSVEKEGSLSFKVD